MGGLGLCSLTTGVQTQALPSPAGHPGGPRVLAVMDEAAGSVRTRVLCGRERSFHRGQFQGACWLAHGVGVA